MKQASLSTLNSAALSRRKLVQAGGAALMIGCLMGATAQAQPRDFDLAAQPLGSALTALARQGQLQIFFESDQVQGLQGPALRGRYEPVEALRQLLRGSGLELVEAAGSFVVA